MGLPQYYEEDNQDVLRHVFSLRHVLSLRQNVSNLMHCLHVLPLRYVLSLRGDKTCRKVHSLHVLSPFASNTRICPSLPLVCAFVCVCVCVFVCVHAYAYARMRARVCVCVCVDVHLSVAARARPRVCCGVLCCVLLSAPQSVLNSNSVLL